MNTTFSQVIQQESAPPADPETKKPLGHAKQRVGYLIRKLQKCV